MPYEKSSPSSPEAQSGSPVQENLQALAALFPSVVRDGQVDFDALRQLLGNDIAKEDELFGLNWRGKAAARRAALTPSLGTLRPCKEESKDWDTTQNLYIEGDNLEVLKLLRKSYGGKVKMIYIDPPYNTGSEFVYPDDYQNSIENYKMLTGQESRYTVNVETSGRYHTNWLNMMYPRLVLARDLLCDDGVIFISIDDNEEDNLKKICNEIFGEASFVSNTIWQSTAGSHTGTDIITVTEHILIYVKNRNTFIFDGMLAAEDSYTMSDEYEAIRGKYGLDKMDRRRVGSHYSEALNYPIIMPDGTLRYPGGYAEKSEEGWNYLWSKTKVEWGIKNGFIEFKNSNGEWSVYNKRYFKVDNEGNFIERTIPYRNLITSDIYNTAQGTREIRELFNNRPFDFPKPSGLIKHLLLTSVRTHDTALILDFFSGSSTTAHAVMQLNAEDKGNRRFIMVQLPETTVEGSEAYKAGYKNICEIGKERIRRAGEKVKEEAGLAGQRLDIGFRVYKLDSSNVKAWNPQEEDLVEAMSKYAEHLVGGRTEDDFLTEIMLKSGIDLVEDVQEREIAGHRVQSLGYGQYYACMSANMTTDEAEAVAIGIAAWHEEDCAFAGGEQQDTCTVFVSDRAFASNDAAKMNFVAILEQHGICNIKAL